MAQYSALQIAKWFLSENKKRMIEGDPDYISHLKLQKLLYYAQGCYLATNNEPLFKEPILCWGHGPVVDEVYQVYENYGSKPIKFDNDDGFYLDIDYKTQGLLAEVFDVFGQYSAWKLREMTHNEMPWKDTARNEVIDNDKIKKYFLKEYVE